MFKDYLYTTKSHGSSASGQTIIEVLIATAVVGLVITAVASGLTFSVKNTAESRYKALASSQAQEVVEVLRRERTLLGWESFVAELASGIYCMNTLPADTTAFTQLAPSECSSGIPVSGTEFTREMNVSIVGSDEVRFTITVSWYDGVIDRNVEVVQELKRWE